MRGDGCNGGKKQLNIRSNNNKASKCQFQVISEVFVVCFLLLFQLQIQILWHDTVKEKKSNIVEVKFTYSKLIFSKSIVFKILIAVAQKVIFSSVDRL